MASGDVAAIIEISALKARFFEAVDRCPAEPEWASVELRTMFAEGIQADYGPFGVFEGSDAYIEFLIASYAQFDWLWHCAHSPRVEIKGREAIGYWTSEAHARLRDSGTVIASINRYRDDFVLTPGGWRFSFVRDILEARNGGSGWIVPGE
jgi:hypothetical protein